MAKVIIGAQMLSLLLATPVTYSMFDTLAQFLGNVRRKVSRKEAKPPEPREADLAAVRPVGALPSHSERWSIVLR
jgi:hypothetical protein